MQTLTAREFQKNFGAITDQVLSGELFTVTKYGRPAYFVIPNNSDSEEAIRRIAGRRLVNNLRNAKATEAAKALTFDEITKLINEA